MKRIIYLVAAALISSCAGGGASFNITGAIKGVVAGDSVMLFEYANKKSETPLVADRVTADSIIVLSTEVKEPQVAQLLKVKGTTNVNYGAIFLEDGQVGISLVEETQSIVFKGTPLNNVYTEYKLARAALRALRDTLETDHTITESQRKVLREENIAQQLALASSAVDANIDNVVGAYIFVSDEMPELDFGKIEERMSQFSDQLKEHKFMVELSDLITDKASTAVGRPYFDIKLQNRDGKALSVSELLDQGNYVLIDFWASWCVPCMEEMPYLKEAYAEFGDKGFEIYAVSMDSNRNKWLEAVDESMPWVNVIRSSTSTATKDYDVKTIPLNFLISPKGKIVAKNLRGEELKRVLGQYVK